jgi:hypothetical protein
MSTAGKRKAAPAKKAAAAAPANSSAPPTPAAKSNSANKKRKTGKEAAVAVAQPADAEEADVAEAEPELEQSDAELLAELESGILTSTTESLATHYNSIVRIIAIASKLSAYEGALSRAPVDTIAVGVSGVQTAVRIFTEWFAAGQFVLSKTASKKKSGDATLQAIQNLLVVQYKKLWALLLTLLQSDVAAVQSNALHAAMDLVQAEGISAAVAAAVPESTVTETLSNGSFHTLFRTLMLASPVLLDTRKEFLETFVGKHSDLRANVYVQLKSLAHLSQADFATAQKEVGGTAASPGAQHIVEFLLDSDWQATLQKQWIVLTPPGGDDEDDLMGLPKMVSANSTPDALKKLYGDTWIGVLRHKQSVETYKKILEKLHAVIIPALPSPLLLADFLTDSYNIGGVVSELATL